MRNSGRSGHTYSPLHFMSTVGSGMTVLVAFFFLLHPLSLKSGTTFTPHDFGELFTDGSAAAKSVAVISLLVMACSAAIHATLVVRQTRQLASHIRTADFRRSLGTPAEGAYLAIPMAYSLTIIVTSVLFAVVIPVATAATEVFIGVGLLALAITTVMTLFLLARGLGRALLHGSATPPEASNNFFLAAFALALEAMGFLVYGTPRSSGMLHDVVGSVSSILAVSALICAAVAIVYGLSSIVSTGLSLHNGGVFWLSAPILSILTIVYCAYRHTVGALTAGPGPHSFGEALFVHYWLVGTAITQFVIAAYCLVLICTHPTLRNHFSRGARFDSAALMMSLPGVSIALLIAYGLQAALIPSDSPAFGTSGYFVLAGIALAMLAASAVSDLILTGTIRKKVDEKDAARTEANVTAR